MKTSERIFYSIMFIAMLFSIGWLTMALSAGFDLMKFVKGW